VFEHLPRFSQINMQCARPLRFIRSRDSGVLERELQHFKLAGLVDEDSFAEYVDERDLRGAANRWTGAYRTAGRRSRYQNRQRWLFLTKAI